MSAGGPRKGHLTREEVFEACERLSREFGPDKRISATTLRESLGGRGSFTTISKHLVAWEELRQTTRPQEPLVRSSNDWQASLNRLVAQAIESARDDLFQAAREEARRELDEAYLQLEGLKTEWAAEAQLIRDGLDRERQELTLARESWAERRRAQLEELNQRQAEIAGREAGVAETMSRVNETTAAVLKEQVVGPVAAMTRALQDEAESQRRTQETLANALEVMAGAIATMKVEREAATLAFQTAIQSVAEKADDQQMRTAVAVTSAIEASTKKVITAVAAQLASVRREFKFGKQRGLIRKPEASRRHAAGLR